MNNNNFQTILNESQQQFTDLFESTKEFKYRVWVGDEIIENTTIENKAIEIYDSLPSGKGKAPSKRRCLEKIEILKED